VTCSPRRAPRTLSGLIALVLLAVALPAAARAGAPTDALRDFFGAVNVVLSDPTTEQQPLERLRAIRRHVDDVFDFREAAMLALGREWTARTPLEQNEFVALFADLLGRSVVARIASRASVRGGLTIHYLSESVDGDTATILTTIRSREGSALPVEYRMIARGLGWAMCDVAVDGTFPADGYADRVYDWAVATLAAWAAEHSDQRK